MFYRHYLDNRKVRNTIDWNFRSFDDTFNATISSIVAVGGVVPKLKKL